MGTAACEACAINDIRRAILNRLKQARIVPWIVLQIGVLDDHDVARHMTDSGLNRRTLSLVLRLKEDFNLIQRVVRALVLVFQAGQNLPTAVLRAVVDQDNFLGQRHGAYATQQFFQRALFVVNRNQDGELHCSNSRFFSSRTKAESLGSALTASLILAWKSAAARSNGLVSTRSPSHWLSLSNNAKVPRGFGETER